MFSSLQHFAHLGDVPQIEGGGTPGVGGGTPSNSYVAEDGTTFYVAEDGTTYYVQE